MNMKLNTKLILLTLCIAIPVLAVLTFTGIRNNRTQLDEILVEKQAEVQIFVSQIDSLLELLENSLSYLSMDDEQIRRIAQAREQDTRYWLDNHEVFQRLQYQMMISGLNMTPFIYFPSQELFYNSEVDPPMTQAVIELIRQKEQTPIPREWKILSTDQSDCLYIILDYQDYYIGAWGYFTDFYTTGSSADSTQDYYIRPDGTVLGSHYGPGAVKEQIPVEETLVERGDGSWYQRNAASEEAPFRLVRLFPKAEIDTLLPQISNYILIVAAVFVLLLLVYIIGLNIWILRPASHLRDSMEIIREGDLEYRIPQIPHSGMEFRSITEEFNRLMDHIEELRISIYEKDLEQQEVRLEYLNRQIQPHFILNSLNTLYNYSESDKEITQKMIRLISQYYRYVVNVNSQFVMLGQELDHIDHYMELQMLRYPDLFTYQIICEKEQGRVLIPPFIIESFIGNIFKHGLVPGEENAIRIAVSDLPEENRICIRIEDSGPGFSDDSLDAIEDYLQNHVISEELGVGIRNSIERLQLIYGQDCSIRIGNRDEGGSQVEIEVPANTEQGE